MLVPRLLITLGDVAGIGPEIVVKAWPRLVELCRPIVVGDAGCIGRAQVLAGFRGKIVTVSHPEDADPSVDVLPCLPGSEQNLEEIVAGKVSAAGGRAAYDFLCRAIELTSAGKADGIVTAPLHKEGLRAAGLPYPGHTEILADKTKTSRYAMMLYVQGPPVPHGLGVIHVTLHMALRQVFAQIGSEAVLEKIQLLQREMVKLCGPARQPRLAVAALNPHAGDGELFGDEERRLLTPAIDRARNDGIDVTGPWPSDTLFVRAAHGEFDGIVAMYHDQGHIPLKLLGEKRAVNICAGLPIVRTSVAHGTAYDIAGRGLADPLSLIEATRVAAKLVASTLGEPGA
jgi:4-hydroxythreonine-4-phosphate dehydrogenase